MRRIILSRPEQATLESTFKTTTDRRLRNRCQAVLMASRGRKRTEIAQDLGVHRMPCFPQKAIQKKWGNYKPSGTF